MIAPDEVFQPEEIENFPDGVNLARLLPAATRRPCLVGIDGRSGAGKTTLTDQLAAVLRRMDAEHAADAQERRITTLVFTGTFDVATSLAALELARAVERATDRMASFGHLLRQYILIDLAG